MHCIVMATALKVLMIGNSFSEQMVTAMPPIAEDMGLELDICSLYIGGCSLESHWQNYCNPTNRYYLITANYGGVGNVMETMLKDSVILIPWENKAKNQRGVGRCATIPQLLKADKWDVVTVQQASHFSWQPATYEPWGERLVKAIRQQVPAAKVVVQETWSYTPWDGRLAQWNIDQDEMYRALHGAYAAFAGKQGCEIIPTGTAVQLVRRELPVRYAENSFGGDVVGSAKFVQGADGKWSPRGDVFHMGPDGNYLQALVWTAKLFKVDVTKCGYAPKGMDPARAEFLRRIAQKAVSGL